MNVGELQSTLRRERIRDDAYSLMGISGDERYCLTHGESGWTVFYHERGIRRDERLFPTENAACRYLLDIVMADPTTR